MKKRTPYIYLINGNLIYTWKKLYIQNGIYGHKKGDFFEPCSPTLSFKISMAQLSNDER